MKLDVWGVEASPYLLRIEALLNYRGVPPLTLSRLRARRLATREIKSGDKRHIDFRLSMLLLI